MIITWWFGEGRKHFRDIHRDPLIYATFSNCTRILLPERHRLTFVLATAAPGVSPRELVTRIHARTNLKARSSEDFKADTVRWYLINSEDVGDVAAMLSMATSVGFWGNGRDAIYVYDGEPETVRGAQGDGRDL